MDDLISRQAAIDALRKMQTYKMFGGDDMLLIDQAGAMTELMLLPPAEPKKRGMNIEQEKMIVEALPSLYPLQEFEEKAIDTVLNAIPKWIPVTERLPETELQHPGHGIGDYLKSDMVAVSGDFDYGDKVWIACYCDDLDGKTYWSDMDANTLYDVVAWMPLPEPYKGVTE